MPRQFLRADWRYLAMLNYEIDPAVLLPFVPDGTELDAHEGRTFVSVVGFRFLKAWVLGLTLPFHRNFDEVNLRFYVRRWAEGGWRRGVVFLKEIVPRRLIAWMARRCFYENFVAMPMRSCVTLPTPTSTGRIEYEWWFGKRWNRLSAAFAGEPGFASPSSLETFIAEHYWGYTRKPDGGTGEFEVAHPRWRLWRAEAWQLDCDVAALYGEQFEPALTAPPASVFVADGSPVIVGRGQVVEVLNRATVRQVLVMGPASPLSRGQQPG